MSASGRLLPFVTGRPLTPYECKHSVCRPQAVSVRLYAHAMRRHMSAITTLVIARRQRNSPLSVARSSGRSPPSD